MSCPRYLYQVSGCTSGRWSLACVAAFPYRKNTASAVSSRHLSGGRLGRLPEQAKSWAAWDAPCFQRMTDTSPWARSIHTFAFASTSFSLNMEGFPRSLRLRKNYFNRTMHTVLLTLNNPVPHRIRYLYVKLTPNKYIQCTRRESSHARHHPPFFVRTPDGISPYGWIFEMCSETSDKRW